MASSRYRGWLRLGTVLTVAWIIGVLAYAAHDYYAANDYYADLPTAPSGIQLPSIPVPEGYELIEHESLLTLCTIRNNAVSCSLRPSNLALVAFLPVASAWLVVSLLAAAFLWVKAGFRREA